MMIALVVAELGTRIPLAGYAYQWSARLVNPTYGWFVGFAGLLYMAVGGGAIMLGVASPLLLSAPRRVQPRPVGLAGHHLRARLDRADHDRAVPPGTVPRCRQGPRLRSGPGRAVVLRRPLWRLKKGTVGVKPVEDLVQGSPQAG
jgi:hypothetical protein